MRSPLKKFCLFITFLTVKTPFFRTLLSGIRDFDDLFLVITYFCRNPLSGIRDLDDEFFYTTSTIRPYSRHAPPLRVCVPLPRLRRHALLHENKFWLPVQQLLQRIKQIRLLVKWI